MKHQRIIVRLPAELLSFLDETASARRLTREELMLDLLSKGVAAGDVRPVWISIEEAARRSDKNVGHLRKLCAGDYESRGMARKGRRGKSRAGWEIRADANPAFAPAPDAIEEE